jgi:hypothetical protein
MKNKSFFFLLLFLLPFVINAQDLSIKSSTHFSFEYREQFNSYRVNDIPYLNEGINIDYSFLNSLELSGRAGFLISLGGAADAYDFGIFLKWKPFIKNQYFIAGYSHNTINYNRYYSDPSNDHLLVGTGIFVTNFLGFEFQYAKGIAPKNYQQTGFIALGLLIEVFNTKGDEEN